MTFRFIEEHRDQSRDRWPHDKHRRYSEGEDQKDRAQAVTADPGSVREKRDIQPGERWQNQRHVEAAASRVKPRYSQKRESDEEPETTQARVARSE